MHDIPEDTYNPATRNRGAATAVLMITDTPNEDLEFFYPYYRFLAEGFRVDVATPKGGAFSGKKGFGLKESLKVADARADDYDLLYLPGGMAPDHMKNDRDVLALVRKFAEQGKTIGAICHGPQIIAAAGVIGGRKISAWPEIENEIADAGGEYVYEEAVADGPFVTARWPADLPQQVNLTLETFRALSGAGRKAA